MLLIDIVLVLQHRLITPDYWKQTVGIQSVILQYFIVLENVIYHRNDLSLVLP